MDASDPNNFTKHILDAAANAPSYKGKDSDKEKNSGYDKDKYESAMAKFSQSIIEERERISKLQGDERKKAEKEFFDELGSPLVQKKTQEALPGFIACGATEDNGVKYTVLAVKGEIDEKTSRVSDDKIYLLTPDGKNLVQGMRSKDNPDKIVVNPNGNDPISHFENGHWYQGDSRWWHNIW